MNATMKYYHLFGTNLGLPAMWMEKGDDGDDDVMIARERGENEGDGEYNERMTGPTCQVNIKTLLRRECLIEVLRRGATIRMLKEAVQDKWGIPPDQQRLIFEGKQLEDGCTLSSQGIYDGATLFLILRLRGC